MKIHIQAKGVLFDKPKMSLIEQIVYRALSKQVSVTVTQLSVLIKDRTPHSIQVKSALKRLEYKHIIHTLIKHKDHYHVYLMVEPRLLTQKVVVSRGCQRVCRDNTEQHVSYIINRDDNFIQRVKKFKDNKAITQIQNGNQSNSNTNTMNPDQSYDKWKIANNPKHPRFSLVKKNIAHKFEISYATVREESGAPRHYNRNGSQDNHFFRAAMFCHEHGVEPEDYVRFAVVEYSWTKSFPTPPNIAGDWLANRWLSKGVKRQLGGKHYKPASPHIIDILTESGFTQREYTKDECRFIETTANDFIVFGNVNLDNVPFNKEIKVVANKLHTMKQTQR